MSKRTALLADKVHINNKNFGSLLRFLSARNVDLHVPNKYPLPIDSHGLYNALDEDFDAGIQELSKLPPNELLGQQHRGINLFDVCRAEALSCFIPISSEQVPALPTTNRAELFFMLYETWRDELLTNMTAARIWLEFWWGYMIKVKPNYILIFSGSLIYSRALLEVSKFMPGRVFMLESFFTGTHFYCEESFEPIANNSDLRFPLLQLGANMPEERGQFEIQRNMAMLTIKNGKNKNVRQPPDENVDIFTGQKYVLLILGQVLNDFSLLEYRSVGLNSLSVYSKVIETALAKTDMNIVFKAHPWENQKANLRRPVTAEYLSSRYENNHRVKVVENFALSDLFRQVDCIFTINSQSGIEAAVNGFCPLQVGDAFWGGRGFSNDCELLDDKNLVNFLINPDKWHLSLDGYDALEYFIVESLDMWLIPEVGNNDYKLRKIFYELPSAIQQAAKPLAKANPPAPTNQKSAMKQETKQKKGSFFRKLKKLFRNPNTYLRDSKYGFLRALSK